MIEIEKKYRLTAEQRNRVLQRLREVGAEDRGEEFEENTIYGGGSLQRGTSVLRLRRVGKKALLTYKERLANASPVKHQREDETAVDDPAAMAIVRKEVKKRQDAIEGFQKGNRPELAAKEQAELEILQSYLPKGLSPEELASLVAEAVAETGATSKAQMGAVMKLATQKAAGRADGKALSAAVAAKLS